MSIPNIPSVLVSNSWLDAMFFDFKRLPLKDLSKVRDIFWCKQTTLNQITVNMQYTRDIGNLGDDERRRSNIRETQLT